MINFSIITGVFPEKLRFPKLKQFIKRLSFRSGKQSSFVNIIPTLTKLYERAMYTRLVQYFEIHRLYNDEQNGLRIGKSVTTVSIDLIETVVEAIDRGGNATEIFVDLFMEVFMIVCAMKHLTALLTIWVSLVGK